MNCEQSAQPKGPLHGREWAPSTPGPTGQLDFGPPPFNLYPHSQGSQAHRLWGQPDLSSVPPRRIWPCTSYSSSENLSFLMYETGVGVGGQGMIPAHRLRVQSSVLGCAQYTAAVIITITICQGQREVTRPGEAKCVYPAEKDVKGTINTGSPFPSTSTSYRPAI